MKSYRSITTLTILIGLLISTMTSTTAHAFLGSSASEIRQKRAMLEGLAILSENGLTGFGPKGHGETSFVVESFIGTSDAMNDENKCSFTSFNSQHKRQEFKFRGEKCTLAIQKFKDAGLGDKQKSWLTISFLRCMYSLGDRNRPSWISCETTKPMWD